MFNEVSDRKLKDLIDIFLKIKSEREMIDFFHGLFTPKELIEFSRRLKIVKMLKKGVPQHEIAEKLGVGVATVTRGSNEIKKGRFKNI
ncbi:MAG: helix-turn-helix domain-containing protein [Candidatus Roizmanbacteria bacterium]|nr:MAG: helix-turn-helix domain-containing protein [Candidatus Roizmanbacteria bacterium]